jgi:hypothetical protein
MSQALADKLEGRWGKSREFGRWAEGDICMQIEESSKWGEGLDGVVVRIEMSMKNSSAGG